MCRHASRWFYAVLLFLWSGTLALPAIATPEVTSRTEPVYFKVAFPPTPDTFVIALTDPVKIQAARDIVAGVEPYQVSVMGVISTTAVDYNPGWRFHLEPDSIQFFEAAIEVCDAHPAYVEEHLAEVGGAFLPSNQWCPWGSRVVEEISWRRRFLPFVGR